MQASTPFACRSSSLLGCGRSSSTTLCFRSRPNRTRHARRARRSSTPSTGPLATSCSGLVSRPSRRRRSTNSDSTLGTAAGSMHDCCAQQATVSIATTVPRPTTASNFRLRTCLCVAEGRSITSGAASCGSPSLNRDKRCAMSTSCGRCGASSTGRRKAAARTGGPASPTRDHRSMLAHRAAHRACRVIRSDGIAGLSSDAARPRRVLPWPRPSRSCPSARRPRRRRRARTADVGHAYAAFAADIRPRDPFRARTSLTPSGATSSSPRS